MMKHQKLFLAMEQRIDDGEFLFQDLNVAVESYDQAVSWLDRITKSDQDAVNAVVQKHGHEISFEGASLEAVQVYINSSQVQAIVDFLKKWIPILIEKIKEIFDRLMVWVRTKLHQIEGRIKKLSQSISEMTATDRLSTPGQTQRTKIEDAAAWILGKSNFKDLFDESPLIDMVGVCLVHFADMKTGKLETRITDQYVRAAGQWLAMGRSGDFKDGSTIHLFNPTLYNQRTIEGLPSPSSAITELHVWLQTYGGKVGSLSYTKSDLSTILKELDQGQMKLLGAATHAERTLRKIQSELKDLKGEIILPVGADTMDVKQITDERTVLYTVRYTLNAVSEGFQSRLRLIGGCLSLLEKAK